MPVNTKGTGWLRNFDRRRALLDSARFFQQFSRVVLRTCRRNSWDGLFREQPRSAAASKHAHPASKKLRSTSNYKETQCACIRGMTYTDLVMRTNRAYAIQSYRWFAFRWTVFYNKRLLQGTSQKICCLQPTAHGVYPVPFLLNGMN